MCTATMIDSMRGTLHRLFDAFWCVVRGLAFSLPSSGVKSELYLFDKAATGHGHPESLSAY